MRISDKVCLVASGSLAMYITHASDCNAYLINGKGGSILIDAGTGLEADYTIREIEKNLAKPLEYILVTHHHADHIGGLPAIQKHFGAKVVVPKVEQKSIDDGDEAAMGLEIARSSGYYPEDFHIAPCKTDIAVSPGDVLTLAGEEIQVFSAAGHSYGGVCYLFKDDGMLFSGDLVMRGGCVNIQNIPGSNIEHYAESVIALADAEFTQLYPGHGCFCMKEGKSHVVNAANQFKSLAIPKNFI